MTRFTRPDMTQVALLWFVGAVLLVTCVLVPAIAGFSVAPSTTPPPATSKGRVAEVLERRVETSPRGEVRTERLRVDLAGSTVEVARTVQLGATGRLDLEAGDQVLVSRQPGPDGDTYLIVDRVRDMPLIAITVAFAALVLVIGRATGAWSLLGLAASLLIIARFIVPGILSGHSPLLIAEAGAVSIMVTTLYLSHGVSWKTTAALGGTTVALALTALLAVLVITAARITGVASEDAATLQVLSSGHIEAGGLLLGGIIIGTLGVLDDVTVAQSAAVFELRAADPRFGPAELYRRAMNVGRDHIASTVNTLVLAYVGASLPLVMLLAIQGEPLAIQLNREFVAIEVVRTLVASIGLIAAVPVTTALAAFAASRMDPTRRNP